MTENLEQLKRRFPLLDYLRRSNWQARPVGTQAEFVGVCPLHCETRPSFYVNARKNLFYCHGCGRGGDLIRFVELSQGLSFRQSVAYLQQEIPPPDHCAVLQRAAAFYQLQLHRYSEAAQYLEQRGLRDPALIEELGIGYAPGGNLRSHLAAQGYSFDWLRDIGLISPQGRDAFCRRVIFPCRQHGHIVNLYGRSIGSAFPHRLLPRGKGGLFAWESVSQFSTVILVEGLFDLAVLWQSGFRNTTSAIGTHLTSTQLDQLCHPPRRLVCIAFDQDENQAGQQAAQQLAQRLETAGVAAHVVHLPPSHDPNRLFCQRRHRCRFCRPPSRSTILMTLLVDYRPAVRPSASPYRLFDEQGREIAWANAFLDAQRLRQLSLRSLRSYAYDLLHFARWAQGAPPLHPPRPLAEITGSTLEQYVADQLDQDPQPLPQTVNHRLGVVRCVYRFHFQCEIPGQSRFQRTYSTRSPLGYGQRRRAVALGLRLKEPHRIIVPLSAEQVGKFWNSFHTFRDLALVGLMLLDGLRSCEVLALQLADLELAGAQMCVLGKGNKQRLMPLPPEIIDVLEKYLHLERPLTNSPALFVSLKGRCRGLPMTPAGLRSLFRHHRAVSHIPQANPHRFRHTFGTDMVRDGISLPALQQLMGHAQIRTTMLYVQLAPQDVWRQYRRAIEQRTRLGASQI